MNRLPYGPMSGSNIREIAIACPNCKLCGTSYKPRKRHIGFAANNLCPKCKRLGQWIDKLPELPFEEICRALKPSEVITLMCQGLINPSTDIVDMDCYGLYSSYRCGTKGCAAPNFAGKIAGLTSWDNAWINDLEGRAKTVGCPPHFYNMLESTINTLRSGNVRVYNQFAAEDYLKMQTFPEEFTGHRFLPAMLNINYLRVIPEYLQFAAKLREVGH